MEIDNEVNEFMDYCYKTDVEVVLDRLKESAKHSESMLAYWKVVKKRRTRDSKRRKVRLKPIITMWHDDKMNVIHTFTVKRNAKFKITK